MPSPSRFLSVDECRALAKRASQLAVGGGLTEISIESTWTSNTRWARNRVITAGDVRDNQVTLARGIRGANGLCRINQLTDTALEAAARRAERILLFAKEEKNSGAEQPYIEPFLHPTVWSDATYHLSAEAQADAMQTLIVSSQKAGMLSAGYIEVSAHGRAVMNDEGRSMYYPFTQAQYSVTVRDPKGTGSGWAGMDHYDWTQIDTQALTERALDKCLRSRNPVALEPGRYTAILEPQAVCDLWGGFFAQGISYAMDRSLAEFQEKHPFYKGKIRVRPGAFGLLGVSRLGERVLDERITISANPMDSTLSFPPFHYQLMAPGRWPDVQVYHPVDWIKNGVLQDLAYNLDYGIQKLGKNTGLPSSGAFQIGGGTTSMDEMIATTKRGLLVTRFVDIRRVSEPWVLSGYTRDGLWLVENGKISKPVKNFRFVESPLFVFNQLEQLGVPVRVFHPISDNNGGGVICPPAKVRDFNFTQLSDAV